jgi:hypothetical protein
MTVYTLIPLLLPVARLGLAQLGVAEAEIVRLLDVIASRVERRITGATWQRSILRRLGGLSEEHCECMLQRYAALSAEGRPLHEWPEDVSGEP